MTDTEILEAIIKHRLWVHPSGGYHKGWTACGSEGNRSCFAWNRPTLRDAVRDALAAGAATKQEIDL